LPQYLPAAGGAVPNLQAVLNVGNIATATTIDMENGAGITNTIYFTSG
jgi:hypothetical protein